MYKDFRAQVLETYFRKRSENKIPPRLIDPTPAGLRDECVDVCNERFSKKDEQTLRTFFGPSTDQKTYAKVISDHKVDDFRSVIKFFKGKTTEPDKKIVELAAWLIDFNPRPYYEYHKIYGDKGAPLNNAKENSGTIQPEIINAQKEEQEWIGSNQDDRIKADKKPEQQNPSQLIGDCTEPLNTAVEPAANPKTFRKTYIITGTIMLFVTLSLTAYNIWQRNQPRPLVFSLTGHEACMFWAGDHYQQVSCSQPLGDTLKVALDSLLLNTMKRITRPDTITNSSAGKLWYIRINHGYEFYTADGFYPPNPTLRLRPLTEYIIRNHVKPAENN